MTTTEREDLITSVKNHAELDEDNTPPPLLTLNFKIEKKEKERLKRDAYRHEMNISEYLRFLIKQEIEKDSK